jgi:uncharacterized membrane protein
MKMYKEMEPYGLMSAVIGVIGMAAWLIPLLGIIVNIPAIYFGLKAIDSHRDGFAMAGVVLGVFGLILTIMRSGLVYYYG